MLEFLDSRKWNLNDLAERLTNIDEIDELRAQVYSDLKRVVFSECFSL